MPTAEEVKKGTPYASWTIAEFEKYQRTRAWYAIAGIVVAILILSALYTANFLFALIIILFSVIVILHGLLEPPQVKITLYSLGVGANSRFYGWSAIDAFWIVYEPPVKKLYLKLKGLRPQLVIDLGEQNPVEIRRFLAQYIPEAPGQTEEPLSETFARVFKL